MQHWGMTLLISTSQDRSQDRTLCTREGSPLLSKVRNST